MTLYLISKAHKAVSGTLEGFQLLHPRSMHAGSWQNSCRAWTSGLSSQAGLGSISQPYFSGFNPLGLSFLCL